MAALASASGNIAPRGPVIGIDFGMSNARVAVYKDDSQQVEIIADAQGSHVTLCYVAWDTNDELLVGESARIQAIENPHKTIFGVKQLLGWSYNDESVQATKKLMPYEIIDKDGRPFVQVTIKGETRQLSPEEITAVILSKLKQNAEEHLGQEVFDAVIAVPAYFNDAQRQATRDAAAIAGLTLQYVISTPKAAGLGYGIDKRLDYNETNVLVLDLGGKTFDTTLIVIDWGVYDVLAANSDSDFGGDDFNANIEQFFISKWKQDTEVDISSDRYALQKLRLESERVKCALSTQIQVRIDIDALVKGMNFSESLSRTEFEELNEDLFKKLLRSVEQVLRDASLSKSEVEEIVLVGDSSYVPKVQQMIKDFFNGKDPVHGVNPSDAVVYGAAEQGHIIFDQGEDLNREILCYDVVPLALGIETAGGLMTKLINRTRSFR